MARMGFTLRSLAGHEWLDKKFCRINGTGNALERGSGSTKVRSFSNGKGKI
jgi:hypothetical protein